MTTYSEILKSINLILKNNFPGVNRPAADIQSGFKKPAFFTQLMPINENDYEDYIEKLVMVNINYFSELKTNEDNIAMLDTLNSVFKNKLKVGERTLNLGDKRYNVVDNTLQFKFNIDFIDTGKFIKVITVAGEEFIPEYELKEELGYTPETISVMEELELTENEEV
jgi:hypothetical protein